MSRRPMVEATSQREIWATFAVTSAQAMLPIVGPALAITLLVSLRGLFLGFAPAAALERAPDVVDQVDELVEVDQVPHLERELEREVDQ